MLLTTETLVEDEMAVPGAHDLAQEQTSVIFVEGVGDTAAKNQCVNNPKAASADSAGGVEMPTKDDG